MNNWKWFGIAQHLIVANDCKFHLGTLVGSGKSKYVVSTVGEYQPRERGKNEQIGAMRLYETMVFKGDTPCTDPLCPCGNSDPVLNGSDLDFAAYNTRADAQNGHMAMCEKWDKENV